MNKIGFFIKIKENANDLIVIDKNLLPNKNTTVDNEKNYNKLQFNNIIKK